MRVAMLSVHSSPLARLGGKEAGGMNVYVRELARELGRQGVAVDVFTRSQDRDEPKVIPLSCNVRVINLHTGPAAPYDKNWVLTYLPEFVSRVRCFADGEDLTYDVIHSHYWLSGEAGVRLRRSWGVPLIHMFHTLGAMKNTVARSSEETETNQRIAIERNLLHAVDAVVAATPLDRAQMVWHYGADPERIQIVPCGVDLRRFSSQPRERARAALGLHPQRRTLLCVGRMEPLKGMDALIEALALLRQRNPSAFGDVEVALVGGEPEGQQAHWNSEQRRLDSLRRQLGVSEAVRFLGSQPQELLPTYFAAADVVAVPSHYESFGLVALEAMACGAAVVASNVGGLASTIEDGVSGLLSPVHDPAALAERIEAMLTQPARANALREGAKRRAQQYAWPQVSQQITRLYAEVIAERERHTRVRRRLAQVS